MISPHSVKRFSGLYASTNPFSRVPEGALAISDNCVIRSSDVLEPRRGFKASVSCGAPVNALTFKQGVAVGITYDNPGAGITGTLRKYDPAADAWTTLTMPSLGSGGAAMPIDRPGGYPDSHTRFVSANRSTYIQSRYGPLRIGDVASGNYITAYGPPPYIAPAKSDLTNPGTYGIGAFSQDSSPGNPTVWLPTGQQVAYRFTLCHFGANNELIESAPSERSIASNTSGHNQQVGLNAMNINAEPMVPPGSFLRIYRCSTPTAIGVTPSDEMFLIAEMPAGYEYPPTFNSFTPTTYDGFLFASFGLGLDASLNTSSVPLYTNQQTGGTEAIANSPPPLSVEICWFRGRMYYLNTSRQQSVAVKIIGTGTGGVIDGDSFTINGSKLTFAVSNTDGFGSLNTTLYTAGTTTANMEDTARRMAAGITYNAQSAIGAFRPHVWMENIAYYDGTPGTGDAGVMLITSVVPGVGPFVFKTSSSLGWDRDYTAGITSDPDAQSAGLSWSNVNQPEGVPLANNTLIGDPTAAGQRCIALKEALFVFKQDGLWKVTDDGSELGPIIQPVDPTIRLVAPESAVALDNFILALCDQGVVLISETGAVANISHTQIEREILALMSRVGSSTLANLAFGVAYQSEHTYILSLPESSNATACTRQYVYNLKTQAWSSWTVPGVLCGAVNPDTGQLYFGRTDGTIWIERKNYDSSDYQDPGFTIASPTTSAVATLVFSGDLRTGTTPFAVGDVIQQFQALHAVQQKVIAVSYNSTLNQTTITLDAVPRYAWTNAVPLTVVKAIQCAPTFLPFFDDEPLQDKEWGDAFLSFRYCDLDFLLAGFTSEKYPLPSGTNPAIERINNADGSLAPVTLQTWAPSPWGKALWGRQTRDVILKATIMQDVQGYSSQLTVSLAMPCALSRFELSALDVKIVGSTAQVTR